VQVIAVAAGIGPVIERSAGAYNGLKLAGALYLVWLGIDAIRHRRSLTAALGVAVEAKSSRRIVREGFVVGITNPKGIVYWTAILPQFIDPGRAAAPVQMLLLGLISVVIATISDSTYGILAGTARAWFARSPRRLEALGGTGGVVMIGLGVSLAASGRKD
jgi:threonine/homoserine/homoserine lactone efflux protein